MVYTISFKLIAGVPVSEKLNDIKKRLKRISFIVRWTQYLMSSRLGIIHSNRFPDFKDALKREFETFPELRKFKTLSII